MRRYSNRIASNFIIIYIKKFNYPHIEYFPRKIIAQIKILAAIVQELGTFLRLTHRLEIHELHPSKTIESVYAFIENIENIGEEGKKKKKKNPIKRFVDTMKRYHFFLIPFLYKNSHLHKNVHGLLVYHSRYHDDRPIFTRKKTGSKDNINCPSRKNWNLPNLRKMSGGEGWWNRKWIHETNETGIDRYPWLTFTNARAIIAPLKYAAHASMIVELSVLGIIVALIVPFRRRCRIPGTRRRCTSMTRVRGMLMTRMTRRVFTLEVIELSPTELRPGPIGVPCNWVEIRPAFNINTSQKRGNENHQRWVWWVDISFEAKDDEERNDHSTYSPKLRSFAILLKILISKMRVSIRVCLEGLREKMKVLVRAKLSCMIF